MKTNLLSLYLLAGTAFLVSSCVKENLGFDVSVLGENEVAFKIGSAGTKAADSINPELFELTSLTPEGGPTLVLEDSVVSVDQLSGEIGTKGTPAFTENVSVLYPNDMNVVALYENGTAAFQVDRSSETPLNGRTFTYMGRDNIWKYNYGEGIWSAEGFHEGADGQNGFFGYFFMRMPVNAPGVRAPETAYNPVDGEVVNGPYKYNLTDGSISFSYTSPTAADQKDILFSSHKRETKVNGEEVIFYHALTGVKFANFFGYDAIVGADNTPRRITKTIIKSVKITGLKDKGDCVIAPSVGGKSADVVTWTNQSGNAEFSQSFEERFADYASDGSKLKGTPINETASNNNLNDNDGSLTFWFIPQSLAREESAEPVFLEVVFDIELEKEDRSGFTPTFKDQKVLVNLSSSLKSGHLDWKAGELHTFTIKPTAVRVDIEDELTDYVKSNVEIVNKGNVWEYVRVNLIGNWMGLACEGVDKNGRPVYPEDKDENYSVLMGYESGTSNRLVNAWSDKNFDSAGNYDTPRAGFVTPYYAYGSFDGLPPKGTKTSAGTLEGNPNWIRHDKYYYYKNPIGPGDAVTDDLFKSYTVDVDKIPDFFIADALGHRWPALNVHLEMDVVVQAIECPVAADGHTPTSTYDAEWAKVLDLIGAGSDSDGIPYSINNLP